MCYVNSLCAAKMRAVGVIGVPNRYQKTGALLMEIIDRRKLI